MAAAGAKRVQDPKSVLLAQDVAKAAFDARDEKSVRKLLRHARIQHFEPKVINLLVGAMRPFSGVLNAEPSLQLVLHDSGRHDANSVGVYPTLCSLFEPPSRTNGYSMEILADARDFADHAGREEIEIDDMRLAVRKKQESLGATLPSREDMIAQAEEVNSKPLPPIPDLFGVRLPPPRYQTTLPNVQWDVDEGVPDKEAAPETTTMEVDTDAAAQGDRNKKSVKEPRLTSKRPLMLKEKKTQEEEQRERDAKRARRRMLAQQAGRS